MNASVCFLLERGTPPRLNPVVAGAAALLERRGIRVRTLYPEDEVPRLDHLSVEADLYLLKSNTELALSLATALEALGGRILNGCRATAFTQDKILAAATLLRAGIPTPRSLAAGEPAQLAAELRAGPLILKPVRGHYGAGLAVVERPAALPAVHGERGAVFAQRYLAGVRTDLKVFAIGDDVFGVRKPFGPASFQAAGEPVALAPEIEQLARRCGRAFGLELYGLDLVEEVDGAQVVDVNAFPGYRGVPDAPSRLAEHISRAAHG
jgi:ribosomal protein S6--L-glutamate ligase